MTSAAGQNATAPRPVSRASSTTSSRPGESTTPATTGTTGTLTPTPDAKPNQSRAQGSQSLLNTSPASSSSGKRKRGRDGPSLATDRLLEAPIVLKPHPSSLTVRPRMLHPLMLLPRENLPLSALDLAQPHGDFPPSRLFESSIKILDLEGRLGSRIVLLARSETSRSVYAVEHESNGLYVLCKLGTWVDIESLSRGATVICRERMRSYKPTEPENAAAAPLTTPSLYKASKRRKLAIEEIQLLVHKRPAMDSAPQGQASIATEESPASRGLDTQSADPANEQVRAATDSGCPISNGDGTSAAGPEPEPGPSDDPPTQPSAEDIFQNIRAQYSEALYHSKGSLAYFAKGPLSRARAAFHPDCNSKLDMNNLIDFLKSLIMTTVLIDKKYRETVPNVVAQIKTLVEESENSAPKSKRRKARKPRLGKDGLYPGEVQHIRKWWASHQPAQSGDEERTLTETEIKYHISCLRRRETQLQMILILEILALEPLARPQDAAEESQQPRVESRIASRDASQEPSTKKKNKHNLPVLLDVHADRLCIWQSITLDEVKALAQSQAPAKGHEGERPERVDSDPLRDFCVDIVVPFFSARLPGLCDSINRKLGGPVAKSPPKEKFAKPAAAAKPKPGAPAKRATASKRDKVRTLERALSHERNRRSVSRGPAEAIALMRSASTTIIPGLKREASEPLLMGSIPRAETGLFKERSANIFPRSLSSSSLEDEKAKKAALVEAELKDAISALKKPNRALAVKEFVEAAERRASSAGQLKKMKKPNRSSAVQVKATPANNRFKDALAADTSLSQQGPSPDAPPSSASVVPSSTLPRKFANRLGDSGRAGATTGQADRVQTTPARAAFFAGGAGLRPVQETPLGMPPSSPIMARKAAPVAPALAPAQPRSQHLSIPKSHVGADLPSSPGLAGLFETPIAPRSAKDRLIVVDDTPIRSRLPFGGGDAANRSARPNELGKGGTGLENGGLMEMSIYQRLGWDTTDLDDIDVMT
ncbi:hypothetical protein VTK56DRAFT_7884 [Thermocarpiscus australiensis]